MTEEGKGGRGKGKRFFHESNGKQHGGRRGKWINPLTANAMPNQVLGEWILRFNGQDQIVRYGNYYY